MSTGALTLAVTRLREWAVRQALPLWATAGFDIRTGRFYECLSLKGVAIEEIPTRLIVQARQIYCFALAARRGWYPGAAEIVECAFGAMVRDYHASDGEPGWVYSRMLDGRVADSRRDLYSHAFALLAIGSYLSVVNRSEARSLAVKTFEFIDRRMHAPKSGGYVEALPTQSGWRRQNPHMHLLEATLALWSATGEASYLGRAGEMFGLFASRFYRADAGVLGEYFTSKLEPADGEAGEIVEPGHLYEWIWLLRWLQRETGRSVEPYVSALYAHAAAYGHDREGLIVDEVRIDGTHLVPTHRVWPVTEAIKASIVEAELGRTDAMDKIAGLANLLFERFLSDACPGGWNDKLDEEGRPISANVPASTFYHLLCAIDELERVSEGGLKG